MMAAVPGYGSSASKVGHSGGARVWEGIEEEEPKTPAQRHLSRGFWRSSDADVSCWFQVSVSE